MSSDAGETAGVATWLDDHWRASALAWAADHLTRAGLEPAGEPEQPRVRAWATVFRLPVRGGGAVWLKAVGPGSAHEPVLAGALGGWVPGHVLMPLAVDPGRRLVLLPDGGRTLRQSQGDLRGWAAMLQAYAGLQLDLVPHSASMLALGVPDTRPGRLPALVGDLLADAAALDGLAPEVRRQLRDAPADVARVCRELADGGIPVTLQHDDLHDGNVFVGNGYRVFDWGDASVSHPFLGLLVTLRMAGRALGLPVGDPALGRLRNAYLEPWSSHGTPRELRDQCDLALRVAPLARALTWRRILRGVPADERAEWAGSVPRWTAEYLELLGAGLR